MFTFNRFSDSWKDAGRFESSHDCVQGKFKRRSFSLEFLLRVL